MKMANCFATILTTLLGLASLSVAGPADAQQSCDRSPILVRNARLWSPSGPARLRDVLFEGDRVASVRPAGGIRIRPGMRVLDGKGQTLLPGLIDLHLHAGVSGGLPAMESPPPLRNIEITGRQLLRSGVTSGRIHFTSLAAGSRLKQEASNPCSPLPRLQVGGPAIAGGLADTENPGFAGVRDAVDAAAKVRLVAQAGLEWIAIYDAHKFRPGELAALTAAARQSGVRLTGSGGGKEELEALLAAGIATIDYMDTSDADLYSDDLLVRLRTMPEADLVPTIGIHYRVHAFTADPRLLEEPSNYAFLTPDERAYVEARAREALHSNFASISARAWPHLAGKFRQLLASGVPMAVGTDVGSEDQFHVGAIWWELEAWRAFGASPRAALTAATTTATHILHDDRAGMLREGAYADFLLYDGDVEQGRFDLKRVRAVAKGGVLFVRDGKWVGPDREALLSTTRQP